MTYVEVEKVETYSVVNFPPFLYFSALLPSTFAHFYCYIYYLSSFHFILLYFSTHLEFDLIFLHLSTFLRANAEIMTIFVLSQSLCRLCERTKSFLLLMLLLSLLLFHAFVLTFYACRFHSKIRSGSCSLPTFACIAPEEVYPLPPCTPGRRHGPPRGRLVICGVFICFALWVVVQAGGASPVDRRGFALCFGL